MIMQLIIEFFCLSCVYFTQKKMIQAEIPDSHVNRRCSVKPWILIIAALISITGAVLVGLGIGGYFGKWVEKKIQNSDKNSNSIIKSESGGATKQQKQSLSTTTSQNVQFPPKQEKDPVSKTNRQTTDQAFQQGAPLQQQPPQKKAPQKQHQQPQQQTYVKAPESRVSKGTEQKESEYPYIVVNMIKDENDKLTVDVVTQNNEKIKTFKAVPKKYSKYNNGGAYFSQLGMDQSQSVIKDCPPGYEGVANLPQISKIKQEHQIEEYYLYIPTTYANTLKQNEKYTKKLFCVQKK